MDLEVAVLQNIENGFFIQVPFSDCVFFIYTNVKMTPMLCFLLFQVADGKEALYNYKFKDGMDMAWVWRYLYYKTLKMAFSYKSLFEIVSLSLMPM